MHEDFIMPSRGIAIFIHPNGSRHRDRNRPHCVHSPALGATASQNSVRLALAVGLVGHVLLYRRA